MKILYHHRTASKDGQAVHIEEMICALREQGHEVHLVAPAGDDARSSNAMGTRLGWAHGLRSRLPRWLYELLELGYSLVAYRALARAAREFQPDVIYERYNLFLLAGLALRRTRGIPLLLEVNAPLAHERSQYGGLGLPGLARWAEGLAWRGADVVLPVTQVLADHVLATGVPVERVVVISNGINEAHFAGAPSVAQAKSRLGLSDALVLGFTGFVRSWHGVDRILHWLARPGTPPQACLLIVGDGPARPELEALAGKLNLRDRVRFTGVVPRDEVPAHVASFDVALQPAVVAYASPLKLFEYLALGKAIVAPAQPNIQEVLSDGRNALLFDPTQPGALEAVLDRLCASSALRSELGVAARESIDRLGLTWQHNASRVGCLAAALARGAPATRPVGGT